MPSLHSYYLPIYQSTSPSDHPITACRPSGTTEPRREAAVRVEPRGLSLHSCFSCLPHIRKFRDKKYERSIF